MVSDSDHSANDNQIKVKPNSSDTSCWNCFATVIENDEPAPLPKIRQQTRERYRLYSFLASQLSRPKAIPLAQKVSENYAIGKKIEKKITEKACQTDLTIMKNIDKDESKLFEKASDIQSPNKTVVDSLSPKSSKSPEDFAKGVAEYIKEYNLFEAYKTVRRKTPTSNGTLNRSYTLQPKDLRYYNSYDGHKSRSELVQRKVTTSNIFSPNIHNTSSTYNAQSEENLINDSKNSSSPDVSNYKRSSLYSPNESIPTGNQDISSNIITPNTTSNKFEPLKFKCESVKIQLFRDKYNLSKKKDIAKKPIHRLSNSSLDQNASTESFDNVAHKVVIETSTPKAKEESKSCSDVYAQSGKPAGKKQEEIDKIIEGIQNISIRTKDQNAGDKVDIGSSNDSESGYSGSSTKDISDLEYVKKYKAKRLSIESGNETESPPLSNRSPKLKHKSSFPALNSRHINESAASTKSLAENSCDEAKKPLKTLRWSAFDLAYRYEHDEVYSSDNIPSGHATLPRRSNSPLPHERDIADRDRLALNKSGIQFGRSESMASVYSGAGEGTRANVTVRGEVQFSLLYNYRLGALEVGVKRCRDLAPVDTKRNRSDPYVKVYLLPDKSKSGKRKTKVKKNTLNPVFDDTLSFSQGLATLSSRTLWLSVWHADMFGRNDFLGEVTLPLHDVVFTDPQPQWYKLHERTEQFDEAQGNKGDLIIGLKLELHESGPLRGKGTLHVLVKEAKNLVATKPNGLADVFCKSYLLPERGRLAKQKTAVSRRTLSPVWEHTFTYRGLRTSELASRALELSLWDRDRLASNEFMGAVRLSLGTGTYMGANVNWMDSTGKEVSLWQTMMQRPNFWVEGSLPLRPQLNN